MPRIYIPLCDKCEKNYFDDWEKCTVDTAWWNADEKGFLNSSEDQVPKNCPLKFEHGLAANKDEENK